MLTCRYLPIIFVQQSMASPMAAGPCALRPPGVFHWPGRVEPIRDASAKIKLSGMVCDHQVISLNLVDVWSRGSKNHHKDQCTPCFSNGSGVPCPRGQACNCCHFAHDDVKLRMQNYHSAKVRIGKGKPGLDQPPVESPPADGQNATFSGLVNQLWRNMSPEQVADILRSAAPDSYED